MDALLDINKAGATMANQQRPEPQVHVTEATHHSLAAASVTPTSLFVNNMTTPLIQSSSFLITKSNTHKRNGYTNLRPGDINKSDGVSDTAVNGPIFGKRHKKCGRRGKLSSGVNWDGTLALTGALSRFLPGWFRLPRLFIALYINYRAVIEMISEGGGVRERTKVKPAHILIRLGPRLPRGQSVEGKN
ncbi:hypothetical protein J6590_000252 [Homalodisca vitripennis]|nr:hypothetical protein J6590_000252 [Homalodisca vitripennis]